MAIMAGMLAGADSARRRRRQQQLRQAGPAADLAAIGSRRSSSSSSSSSPSLFSHTTKRSETHHSVTTPQIIRSNNNNNNNNNNNYINRELHDWNLGSGAREAKERLDEKLRNQRASVITSRRCSVASVVGALQREIFFYRKSARRLTWSNLVWNKTSTAEAKPDHAVTECAVCLEEFRAGDELIHLPCAHRFHRSCAVPWLEISPNCPFCRTCIFSIFK